MHIFAGKEASAGDCQFLTQYRQVISQETSTVGSVHHGFVVCNGELAALMTPTFGIKDQRSRLWIPDGALTVWKDQSHRIQRHTAPTIVLHQHASQCFRVVVEQRALLNKWAFGLGLAWYCFYSFNARLEVFFLKLCSTTAFEPQVSKFPRHLNVFLQTVNSCSGLTSSSSKEMLPFSLWKDSGGSRASLLALRDYYTGLNKGR